MTVIKLAVLGNPVDHSLSPQLHAFFGEHCGLDVSYTRVKVPHRHFDECASRFFAEGGTGCNVTVPCKGEALAFAQRMTHRAQLAGAANTLCHLDADTFLADNTDGAGLVMDLGALGFTLRNSRILIIGAGGAARGILDELRHEQPASITITNRTYLRALELSRRFEGVEAAEQKDLHPGFDLIINASASSLHQVLPMLDDRVLAGCSLAYDLMYTPTSQTVFTRHAAKLGVAQVSDGLGMLICQGALSFRLWTGREPDLDAARSHMRTLLASMMTAQSAP